MLLTAGTENCHTSARGHTATLGNLAWATLDATSKVYSHLTPALLKVTMLTKAPYQEFTDHLVNTHSTVSVQKGPKAHVLTQE